MLAKNYRNFYWLKNVSFFTQYCPTALTTQHPLQQTFILANLYLSFLLCISSFWIWTLAENKVLAEVVLLWSITYQQYNLSSRSWRPMSFTDCPDDNFGGSMRKSLQYLECVAIYYLVLYRRISQRDPEFDFRLSEILWRGWTGLEIGSPACCAVC